MALVISDHIDLSNQEQTALSQGVSAAGTVLTVANNGGFVANKYVVVGNPGDETTEIVQISTVSGNNTINVGALKLAHAMDTPISITPYNQVRFYGGATQTGSFTLIMTVNMEVGYPDGTRYEDTTTPAYAWYKTSFYNSYTTTESSLSDPMPSTGIPDNSVRGLTDAVVVLINDQFEERADRKEILRWLNEAYRKGQRLLRQKKGNYFLKDSGNISVATTTLPSDFYRLHRMRTSQDGVNYRTATYIDLRDDMPGYSYNSQSPFFSFMGSSLVWKPDNISGYYRMVYHTTLNVLDSDGDVPMVPLSEYTEFFINYAIYRFCQIYKSGRSAEFKGIAEESYNAMAEEINERQEQDNDYIHITDDSYGEVLSHEAWRI